TSTNLSKLTQMVSNALDNRYQVDVALDVAYTDLSKAFEKVNHCIMLEKLYKFGLCNNLLRLFRSLLTKRKQYVEYLGCKSVVFESFSGVVQGSNLSPLMFMIFINDITNFCIS